MTNRRSIASSARRVVREIERRERQGEMPGITTVIALCAEESEHLSTHNRREKRAQSILTAVLSEFATNARKNGHP